ncbi:MAG: acyl-CoA dehydrogenase family protein, partial [Pseudomonadales bacterium]
WRLRLSHSLGRVRRNRSGGHGIGVASSDHRNALSVADQRIRFRRVSVHLCDYGRRVADAAYREKILKQSMTEKAFQLTTARVVQENQSGQTPGATTSIFKLVGSTLARESAALKSEIMGIKGLGWEGEGFDSGELEATRNWLNSRAVTIYGGTNEVQMNIIGKRVLGLPD